MSNVIPFRKSEGSLDEDMLLAHVRAQSEAITTVMDIQIATIKTLQKSSRLMGFVMVSQAALIVLLTFVG